MKKIPGMITALVLCVCFVLLCGIAGAEEIHVLGSGNWDDLDYQFKLPDGRILLTGAKEKDDSDDLEAWVLCLNPDRTVSWEYLDREPDGYTWARLAAMMPDGTIAVEFENIQLTDRQNGITVRFFTQDGQLTGKEVPFSLDYIPFRATPNWLMLYRWKEGDVDETLLTDWDGNELLRYDGLIMPGAYGFTVENTEELVLFGHDTLEDSHAKIMKLDGLTDNVLWETTLEWQLPDTVEARFDGGIKTEDGGYAVLLEEGDANTDAVPYVWRDFLVKVDAEGRVQWINRESFERDNLSVRGMFSHNGKIVVYCGQVRGSDEDPAQPWVFRWFDEDGKEIGTTEIKLNAEDFSVMSQYLEPEEEGVRREPVISFAEEIPMGDELWALGVCYANEWNGDEETGTCVESRELVLVRLPELE